MHNPEGESTQYLKTLVLKTMPLMVFGNRILKYWVLGPSGKSFFRVWFQCHTEDLGHLGACLGNGFKRNLGLQQGSFWIDQYQGTSPARAANSWYH